MNDSSGNNSTKRRSLRKKKPPDMLGYEAEDIKGEILKTKNVLITIQT